MYGTATFTPHALFVCMQDWFSLDSTKTSTW